MFFIDLCNQRFFIVYFQDVNSFLIYNYCRANYGDIIGNEFTVKGLQDGKEYDFRVAAVNDAGPGAFSETADSIKARPPPGIFLCSVHHSTLFFNN